MWPIHDIIHLYYPFMCFEHPVEFPLTFGPTVWLWMARVNFSLSPAVKTQKKLENDRFRWFAKQSRKFWVRSVPIRTRSRIWGLINFPRPFSTLNDVRNRFKLYQSCDERLKILRNGPVWIRFCPAQCEALSEHI